MGGSCVKQATDDTAAPIATGNKSKHRTSTHSNNNINNTGSSISTASIVTAPSPKHDYKFLHHLPARTVAFQEPPFMDMLSRAQMLKSLQNPDLSSGWSALSDPLFMTVSQIIPHLFLTSMPGMNLDSMAKHRITYIINTTVEMPMFANYKHACLRVPVSDDRSEDIHPFLDHAADAIRELLASKNQESIVVHCQAGVSRSAVIILAYLIKHEKRSLRNAYNHLVSKRTVVRPNSTFLQALVTFEHDHIKELENKERTTMITVKKHGKMVDLPNWLWYDQKNKFDDEFAAHRSMNLATRHETRKIIDLDQDPGYFAEHEADFLRLSTTSAPTSNLSLVKKVHVHDIHKDNLKHSSCDTTT